MKITTKFLLAAAFATGAAAHLSAQLTVTSEGATYSASVTDNGIATIYTPAGQVYTWDKNNGLVEIGAISNGKPGSGRPTISNDGKYISATMTNPDNGFNEMSLYDTTTKKWTHLGGLSTAGFDGSISSAWNMTADGSAIVGLSMLNAAVGHAVIWKQSTGMVALESTMPDRSSRANAVNADGTVVVGWQDKSNGRHGVRWVNGVQSPLQNDNGANLGEGQGISADGSTVIGSFGARPYVWHATKGTAIIDHPSAGQYFQGSATAISADGKIVIGYYRPFPGPAAVGEGFIWTEENGRKSLNEYATELGIDTKGVKMGLPLGISADGSKIVGTGVIGNKSVTFLLDLTQYMGVSETINATERLAVYPNPVKDVLNINSKGVEAVEVYNANGQKVLSLTGKNAIDVNVLPKGVYMLKATINGKTNTTKFIKE